MPECLGHVGLAAVTAVAWLGLGSVLLRPLRVDDRLLDALNRVAAGAAGFALLTFAAGLLGLLHAALYGVVLVAAALAGGVASAGLLRGTRLPDPRAWRGWEVALAGLIAAYALTAVVITCAPVSSPDALAYHAAAPALFERVGGIGELEWSWATYQPFTVEMLVLDGLLLSSAVQGAFAPLLLALGALAAVLGAAHRLAGRSVALLAGAAFFAQPFLLWEATSTFVEPALAFAVTLAAWNAARFVAGPAGRDALVLAGLLAGVGAGMKYVGLATAGILAGGIVLLARRKLDARAALAFAVPAALVALPWYAKNLILTGDPLYPLLAGGRNPEIDASRREILEGYGHGRSPLDAVLLPFRLLGDAEAFDRGAFLSPLFLAFAPLALLVPRVRRVAAVVWAVTAVYVAAWFVTSQQARFLTAVLPALAVLAGVAVLALAARGRAGRVLATVSVAGALAVGAAVSAVYAAQFVPVAVGAQRQEDFLREKTSFYALAAWINANLPPGARVLVQSPNLLYVERDLVGWTLDALPLAAGPRETSEFVRRTGITHAAVIASHARRVEQVRFAGGRLIAEVPATEVRSRTLTETGEHVVFLVYEIAR